MTIMTIKWQCWNKFCNRNLKLVNIVDNVTKIKDTYVCIKWHINYPLKKYNDTM